MNIIERPSVSQQRTLQQYITDSVHVAFWAQLSEMFVCIKCKQRHSMMGGAQNVVGITLEMHARLILF